MQTIAEKLDLTFNDSIPEIIQESLLRCVFTAYKIAYEGCEKFAKEEAHDLRPFYRWVQLRNEFRGLAERFKELTVDVEPNGSGGTYYILLACKQIMLTASALEEGASLPRPAKHRDSYSYQSQLHLFVPDKPPPPDATFYGILVHGADRLNPQQPEFTHFIFPTKDYISVVHKIDLFKRFPELVDSLRVPIEETGDRVVAVSELEEKVRRQK